MRVNFDYSTNETVVRLTELEVVRLTAVVANEINMSPDPEADPSALLEAALSELFT